MTRPVGRIEIWEPNGETPLYTIDDAQTICFKEVITNAIGNFAFTVYSHKDFSGNYTYPNIDLGDKVKIWLDYDTIAGNPNFIGRVTNRLGPLLTETGWVRRIAGLSEGEILLRRFKTNKLYSEEKAATIISEWASNLNLGVVMDDPVDETPVTLKVETKSFFDLLRWISDYKASAEVEIKKDFIVLNNNLIWKARPFRDVDEGVESFTTADFLADPLVERELEPVKNNITVYGQKQKLPANGDYWTETGGTWSGFNCTVEIVDDGDSKIGSKTTRITQSNDYYMDARVAIGEQLDCTGRFKTQYERLHFWLKIINNPNPEYELTIILQLSANSTTSYFYYVLNAATQRRVISDGQWHEFNLELGPDSNLWSKASSPSWGNITKLRWWIAGLNQGDIGVKLDELYFYGKRYLANISGPASIAAYQQRDFEVVDDKLLSDSDCEKRAGTLLYQLKDPPIQITATVKGNDNVLAGDRLGGITIPSEGINAQPYDVIAVENLLNLENWTTKMIMVNSENWRTQLQLRQQIEMRRQIRELNIDEKGIR